MRIEKRLAVEFNDLADQPAVGVIGRRLDDGEHSAEIFRQRMRAQSDAGDDAEPAAAAFQRPEKIGIRAGVGDSDFAVRSHDLHLDEARGREAICLGVASEAASQDETCDANRHAAAALDVTTALGRHLVIDMSPNCARFD